MITLSTALLRPKKRITIIRDRRIRDLVQKKAKLTLKRIIIFESEKLFGMMPGLPFLPEMILSRGIYEKFTWSELEWVILHEAGHCVMWHNAKCALVQGIILIVGTASIDGIPFFKSTVPVLILTFMLSTLTIRIMRFFEYEADYFSILRVDNPKGVISAQAKLVKSIDPKWLWLYSEQSFLRKLLFWNILPSKRISMAHVRLKQHM